MGLQSIQTNIEGTNRQISTLSDDIDKLTVKKQDYEQSDQLDKAQSTQREIESKQQQIADFQRQITGWQQQADDFQQKIDKHNQERNVMVQQLDQLNQQKASIEAEISKAQSAIDMHDQNLQTLQ